MALEEMEGKTIMYTPVGVEWRQFGYPRKHRAINSVILDQGVTEAIVDDIKGFVSTPQWYMERGECLSEALLKMNTILLLFFRHSLSSWLPSLWSARLWKE